MGPLAVLKLNEHLFFGAITIFVHSKECKQLTRMEIREMEKKKGICECE